VSLITKLIWTLEGCRIPNISSTSSKLDCDTHKLSDCKAKYLHKINIQLSKYSDRIHHYLMVLYCVRTPCMLVHSFHFFEELAAFTSTSTSQTETAYTFNMLLITYQSTCYHNPEDHNPDSYHYKHLRFHTPEFITNTSTTCNTSVAIVSCGFVNKLQIRFL